MRGFQGCCFEDLFAAADDVDFVRAVEGEGLGHHEADSAAAACDDGDELVDVEKVGGGEGGHYGQIGVERAFLFGPKTSTLPIF